MNRMAVLYRSHFHALELQLELTKRNILFSITSGIRFFEQAHIKDVTAYLKLVGEPPRRTLVQAAGAVAAGHWRQGGGQSCGRSFAGAGECRGGKSEGRNPKAERRAKSEGRSGRAGGCRRGGAGGCDWFSLTPSLSPGRGGAYVRAGGTSRGARTAARSASKRARAGCRRRRRWRWAQFVATDCAIGSGRRPGQRLRDDRAGDRSRLRGLPGGELRELPVAAGGPGTVGGLCTAVPHRRGFPDAACAADQSGGRSRAAGQHATRNGCGFRRFTRQKGWSSMSSS
jgi:hypothetical protein